MTNFFHLTLFENLVDALDEKCYCVKKQFRGEQNNIFWYISSFVEEHIEFQAKIYELLSLMIQISIILSKLYITKYHQSYIIKIKMRYNLRKKPRFDQEEKEKEKEEEEEEEEEEESRDTRTPLKQFHDMADTFKLDVELFKDSITIRLQDYVMWAHFQKQLTDEDVGKHIHRAINISLLFDSFCQTQNKQDDASLMKNQEKGTLTTNIRKYVFGSVIKNGQCPCYKIERGGKITAYTSVTYQGSNKKNTYESVLRLDKVKDMVQTEKLAQTFSRQKRELSEQFIRQLKTIKEQRAIDLARIEKLEQQNKKIKTEFTNYQENTPYYIMESLPQLFAGKFKIYGYQCILNTSQRQWTQFMFNKFIPFNGNFVFKIKVTRTSNKYFMIGVVDYQRKDQRSSYPSGHAVCYYSAANCKYPSGTGQGSGFVQGEIIEVTVNRAAKTIKWCVNGTQRAFDNTFAALGQQARMFVPYIQMYYQNDSLEWVP